MQIYWLKAGAAIGICTAAGVFLAPKVLSSQPTPDRFIRIAAALEAYALDHNGNYPPASTVPPGNQFYATLSTALTTPVAYLDPQDMIDPFTPSTAMHNRIRYFNFDEYYRDSTNTSLQSFYPRYYALHGSWLIWSGTVAPTNPATGLYWDLIPYDPTNGALSRGSIFRSQKIHYETGITSGTE